MHWQLQKCWNASLHCVHCLFHATVLNDLIHRSLCCFGRGSCSAGNAGKVSSGFGGPCSSTESRVFCPYKVDYEIYEYFDHVVAFYAGTSKLEEHSSTREVGGSIKLDFAYLCSKSAPGPL